MTTIHRDQLLKQLNWRYATKQFDAGRKISTEDWAALEEALLLLGEVPLDGENDQVRSVSHLTLPPRCIHQLFTPRSICDDDELPRLQAIRRRRQDVEKYIERIAEVRGLARESLDGFRDMMVGSIIKGMDESQRKTWASRQAYIALGNFLNSAALLGIDACPMEGIEPEKYDQILGLDQHGLNAVVVAAPVIDRRMTPTHRSKRCASPKSRC
jgi:hypothetical protein